MGKSKKRDSLLDSEESVKLTRKLVDLVKDVPLGKDFDSLKAYEPPREQLERLLAFFEKYEMDGLKARTQRMILEQADLEGPR